MSMTAAILIPTAFFVAGLVLIYGAWRKWSVLVNPPDFLWPFYSQAFIKKHFGQRVLIYATYIMGVLIALVALGLLVNVLMVTQLR